MKLNLGCGNDYRQGYVNIDIRPEVNPDMVLDLEQIPYPFDDESVEEILAFDIIEHFPFNKIRSIVNEWYRILKKGGILKIRTPDFDQISYLFYKGEIPDWIMLSYYLYGAQDYEYNYHKAIFTKSQIKDFLESFGFRVVKLFNEYTNMYVEAVKEG